MTGRRKMLWAYLVAILLGAALGSMTDSVWVNAWQSHKAGRW